MALVPKTTRGVTGLSWLSLLLVIAGPVSYLLLLDVPFLRSTAALALVLMVSGTALGFAAGTRSRAWGRWTAPAVGVLLTTGFLYSLLVLAVLPASHAIEIQTPAPNFTAPDHNGTQVTLYDTLASGPVLLVFYRGYW